MKEENGVKFYIDSGHRLELKFWCFTLSFGALFPLERMAVGRHIVVYGAYVQWNGKEASEELKRWAYDKVEEHLESQGYLVEWEWPSEDVVAGPEANRNWYVQNGIRQYIRFVNTLPKVCVNFAVDRFAKEKHIVVFRQAAEWLDVPGDEVTQKWVEQRIEEYFKRKGMVVVWDDRKVVERVPEPVRWAPRAEPERPPGCLGRFLLRVFAR